jgi:polysaccharide export outer membrane protein
VTKRPFQLCLALAAAAAMLGWSLSSRAAGGDYRLRPGDTIEISVVGVPDLKQRLTLDVDGRISVSMVGLLRASGSTVAELTEQLQRTLPTRAFRTGADGKTGSRAMDDGEVVVNIAEYAPVYINGDVAKPGEQRFRPNMTVRQAVSEAGGFEVMRYRFNDPVLLSADLSAEYQSLWVEQAQEQARLARLQAQLNDKTEFASQAQPTPVPGQFASDLAAAETKQFSLWTSNLDKERDFLKRAIDSATAQLAELTEQREKEKEGVQSDTGELQRLQQFNERGDVTANRVVEQRRSMLLSSTRLLQTEAQITQITREKEGYLRQIERLNEGTKLELLKEIEDLQTKLASTNAKLAATADKIDYAGTMRSQLAQRAIKKPAVLIVRRSDASTVRIGADEDMTLEPGDVVEISLTTLGNPATAQGGVADQKNLNQRARLSERVFGDHGY